MLFITLLQHYLQWHYTRAYGEMFTVFRNLVWFFGHFFSIGALSRSLFTPFKRITEERQKAWSFEDLAGRIIINTISRIIGAVMRGAVILLGLSSILITSLVALLIYVLWFAAPGIIASAIGFGIALFFL